MKIKCPNCGKKNEVFEMKQFEPIKAHCLLCGDYEVNYSESLFMKYKFLKIFDTIIAVVIISDVILRLILKFIFKWDIFWISMLGLLIFGFHEHKMLYRILGGICIASNLFYLLYTLYISMPMP